MKEKTIKFSLLLMMLCMFSNFFWAQNQHYKPKQVSGKIIDNSAIPLVGVSVILKHGGAGTITDLDGNYSIKLSGDTDTLVFSYTGFETQEVVAKGNVLNIILKERISELSEVVVIGYGSMKKRDITGSISSVSQEALTATTPTNVLDAIQGQAAGVEITSNSGAPGEGSNVRVRGTATFEGGANPLFVVDGVIYDNIDDLNPDDVVSVEILKDAASAAIYGSRSANGVFLVTTKQGDKSDTKLNVRYQRSYSGYTRKMPVANGAERKYYDAVRREISSVRNDQTYGFTITDTLAYFTNQDLDMQDLIFRMAVKDEVNLSTSGAGDAFKYYVNTGYVNEEGIIVNSNYNRLSARINSEYSPSKKLSIGSKIYMSASYKNGISESGVLNQLIERIPYWAVFNPDGTYVPNISNRRNSYAVAMTDVDKEQRYKVTLYEYLNYKLNKNLSFNTNIQGNYAIKREQWYRPQSQLSITEQTTGRDYSTIKYDWTNENYFSYKNKFLNVHQIDAMLGCSFQASNKELIRLVGLNYTTDELYTLNAASGFDAADSYTRFSEHKMVSFFGRASYSYKGKYLANFNLRYDGSSRFGINNRWGAFPSGSLAWRFSDEKFMRPLNSVFEDAKLRVSYGVTGNEQIGDYVGLLLYSPNYIYENVAGISASNLAYNDLSWEETSQLDVGLDLSLFNNRIKVVADYYKKNTDKLLNRVELPKETGFTTIYKNVGSMMNEGFEFTLGLDLIRKKSFRWSVDFNFATNDSYITKIADGIPFYKGSGDAIYVQENARLGEFYGYKYLGIFAYDESNAFTDEWERLTPVFNESGMFQYYTFNGEVYNGTVNQKKAANGDIQKGGDVDFVDKDKNGTIDILDKDLIGCAQPDFFGGLSSSFTYKDFSIDISFYYSIGGKIYNYAEAKRNRFRQDGATPSPYAIHNMWTKQGDEVLYAAPIISEHNSLAPSDFYLEDASYIKIKNLRLSYSLPKKVLKKSFLNSTSVYVYGKNLLTLTNYKGYDPEFSDSSDPLSMGIDTSRYPRKREFGMGLSVGL